MRALNTAATGMQAQQLNVEVIANNIANMNTTGFKRQRAEFQDLLYQNVERMGVTSSDAGTIVPTGVQVGVGVKSGAVYRVTEQGNITQTNNPFDMAIQGDGYYIVQMPDGRDAYTRAGNFARSPDGQVVTEDGFIVAPGISIPEDAVGISINREGVVQAIMPDGSDPQDVGALELARFVNPAGLEAIHAGHHDIHKNDIGLPGLQVLDAILARSSPIDLDAALQQQLAQGQVSDLGIIHHQRLFDIHAGLLRHERHHSIAMRRGSGQFAGY
jgi:flagellar basal-body rod protein FlgG